jgi:GNAT superfamily N-acetyltransferase
MSRLQTEDAGIPMGLDPALRLRVAGPADIGAVVTLVESAYRGESSRTGWTTEADLLDGQRTDWAAVSALIASPDSEILVVERDGELLGCCHLARHGEAAAFGLFAVRPEWQGRGIGRSLVAEAERRAKKRYGTSTIRMTVISQRRELIDWYGRLGYAATGERIAFPYGDERFGLPRRDDLEFLVLERELGEDGSIS